MNQIEEKQEKPHPVDRYRIVYIVFYLQGASILLPWVFFVTCTDYWMYRFRNLHNNSSDSESNRSPLQADFMSYISIASTVPCCLLLFFIIFYLKKFSIHWLIVISSIIVLALFVETTALVLFNTDTWQSLFFIITITTVVILNLAVTVLQAATSALFIKFPSAYISAATSGQSVAGIFAAVAQISVLLWNWPAPMRTFLYFTFADIAVLFSIIGYFYMIKTEFFMYYVHADALNSIDSHSQSVQSTRSIQHSPLHNSDPNLSVTSISYFLIFKKTWILIFTVFWWYIISSSVYPAVAVLVSPEKYMERKSPWTEKYFVPVITYLLYCICEYIGRILAGYIQKPKGISLLWLTAIRVIFIPLFMVSNAQPRHHLPVLINSDLIYAFIVIIFAVSNGYVTTLTFVLLPKCVSVHEQEVASTMLITSLVTGVSIGSLLSYPLINML